MVTAFILMLAEPGKEREVLNALSAREEVVEAKSVYGDYDIVTKINVTDMGALNDLIFELRKIPNISATSTLIQH